MDPEVNYYPRIFVRWFQDTAMRLFNDPQVMGTLHTKLLQTFVNAKSASRFRFWITNPSDWTPEQVEMAKVEDEERERKKKKKMTVYSQLMQHRSSSG